MPIYADDNAQNTPEAIFDLTYAINIKGVWFGCKHAIEAMRNNPTDASKGLTTGGSIINTASSGSLPHSMAFRLKSFLSVSLAYSEQLLLSLHVSLAIAEDNIH